MKGSFKSSRPFTNSIMKARQISSMVKSDATLRFIKRRDNRIRVSIGCCTPVGFIEKNNEGVYVADVILKTDQQRDQLQLYLASLNV